MPCLAEQGTCLSTGGGAGVLYALLEQARLCLDEFESAPPTASEAGPVTHTEFLPVASAVSGIEIRTPGDAEKALSQLERRARRSLDRGALNRVRERDFDGCDERLGLVGLAAAEIIAAAWVGRGAVREAGCGSEAGDRWEPGLLDDRLVRSWTMELLQGRKAGTALLIGEAARGDGGAAVARALRAASLIVFSAAPCSSLFDPGPSREPGGRSPSRSEAFFAGFALRFAALAGGPAAFGPAALAAWMRGRAPFFALLLGPVGDREALLLSGLHSLGIPIIRRDAIGPLGRGECPGEERSSTPNSWVRSVLREGGIQVPVDPPRMPVACGPEFGGERVVGREVCWQLGSPHCNGVEVVIVSRNVGEDGVRLIPTGADREIAAGARLPLGLMVEVSGREMHDDFAPLMERRLHEILNSVRGLVHMGGRDDTGLVVSHDSWAAGLTLEHVALYVHARLHSLFAPVVDCIRVTATTEGRAVEELAGRARTLFEKRDRRACSLRDEDVDEFYSCAICQSIVPFHVCVLSPERPGPCGCFTWVDARAGYRLDPTGPHRPISKGVVLDARLGRFAGVDSFLHRASQGRVNAAGLYSLMHDPVSSCACFELVTGILPACGGVMVVGSRDEGPTPIGLSLSELREIVGGGTSTPGCVGHSKRYLVSRKYLAAEGGIARVVWMPERLKNEMARALEEAAGRAGCAGLLEKIATEAVTVEEAELRAYLEHVQHPALTMPPLL